VVAEAVKMIILLLEEQEVVELVVTENLVEHHQVVMPYLH
tara:strand:- start:476 stop:595 length:120 start_codon:yes stop_codon:yes gene_type:complete